MNWEAQMLQKYGRQMRGVFTTCYGKDVGGLLKWEPGQMIPVDDPVNDVTSIVYRCDPFCSYCGQRNSKAKCENCGAPMVNP